MHEKILNLINMFFQGLIDKKMKEQYGENWVIEKLLPYARKLQNAENGFIFEDFLKKAEKRKTANLEDIDTSLGWYLISVDSNFGKLFQLDQMFYDLVCRMKESRNALAEIRKFKEAEKAIVYKRSFLNIKMAYMDFQDEWEVSVACERLYSHIEDCLFTGIWGYDIQGNPEMEVEPDNYEKAYENVQSLMKMGETYYAKKKLDYLNQHGYAPAIMNSAVSIKDQKGLEQSINYLKNIKSDSPQIKELLFSYENMKDLMEGSKQGYPESSYYLGIEYENPVILQKDEEKAVEYFIIACKALYKPAKVKVLEYAMQENEQAVACIIEDDAKNTNIFKEDIAEWKISVLEKHEAKFYPIIKRLAVNWDSEDLYRLSNACRVLSAVDRNYDVEETNWLEFAIKKRSNKAKFALGYKYALKYKSNKKQNSLYNEAQKLMEEAYAQEHSIELIEGKAYYLLSLFYLGQFAEGREIDFRHTRLDKVIETVTEAISNDVSEAYIWFASLFTLKGIMKEMPEEAKLSRADTILKEGAGKGYPDVQCELGYFSLYGETKNGFYISDKEAKEADKRYYCSNEILLDTRRPCVDKNVIKSKDYRLAVSYFEQAAKRHYDPAMLQAGKCYLGMLDKYNYVRIPSEVSEGIQWLERVIDQGSKEFAKEAQLYLAMFHLGYLFFETRKNCVMHSFSRDAKRGFKLLHQICNRYKNLNKKYYILLALSYAQGNGVEVNHEQALKILLKCKGKNDTVEFEILLGIEYYELGRYEEAAELLAAGCGLGIAEALYYTGICYMKPFFSKMDFDRGYEMIKIAAEKDYIPAINRMVEIYTTNGIRKNIWEKKLKEINKVESNLENEHGSGLSGLMINL